jgi:ABC-type Fe3+ transport system permease subunit
MGQIELDIAVMAGLVLSLFLIVGEIAALRKQAARVRKRWRQHYRTGKFFRIFMEFCAVAAFFLIQPVLVAVLVVMALGNFNPEFSAQTIKQLRQEIHGDGNSYSNKLSKP